MKLFLFIFSLCFSLASTAQNDVVLKLNGEEMSGKVTEINDDNIRFIYKGETETYTIKKADIMKITFANGTLPSGNSPLLIFAISWALNIS
jgi:preprotein translocase subunit YajC